MIERLDVSSVHTVIDDKLHKYIIKKIGHLDKYIPRSARPSAHAEVRIKQSKSSDNRQFSCDITLRLPHETITVTESTSNAFSAVDIAEAKLKVGITKYKTMYTSHRRIAATEV